MSRRIPRARLQKYMNDVFLGAASHETREGGRYTYYMGFVQLQEEDAAHGFANCWMPTRALREMAAAKDMRLAHSAEVVLLQELPGWDEVIIGQHKRQRARGIEKGRRDEAAMAAETSSDSGSSKCARKRRRKKRSSRSLKEMEVAVPVAIGRTP